MKITDQIFYLPPYISTTWENIESLSLEKDNLIVILKTNQKVEIPNLDQNLLTQIYESHARFLEKRGVEIAQNNNPASFSPHDQLTFRFPMQVEKEAFDAMKNAMEHSPEHSSNPDIPEDILKRVALISNIFSKDTLLNFPKAEPNCNCPHCQIARAMQKGVADNISEEEQVSDEELKFKEWDIKKTGEKLYLLTNPLDPNEHYTVFLGEPLGCTCGQEKCEHIRAVLQS